MPNVALSANTDSIKAARATLVRAGHGRENRPKTASGKAISRAQTAVSKANDYDTGGAAYGAGTHRPGNPNHDPSTGQFSSGGGGGGSVGGVHMTGPFSGQIRQKKVELDRAVADLRSYRNSGVSPEDEDHKRAAALVASKQEQLRSLFAQRKAEIARQGGGQQQTQRQPLSIANVEAEANRILGERPHDYRTEAQRIQEANRDRMSSASSAVAAGHAISQGVRPSGGLGSAFFDTTRRLATIAGRLTSIAGNAHGITSRTSSFGDIGNHLTNIQNDVGELRHAFRALPADVKNLHSELGSSIERLNNQVGRVKAKLQAKLANRKKKK